MQDAKENVRNGKGRFLQSFGLEGLYCFAGGVGRGHGILTYFYVCSSLPIFSFIYLSTLSSSSQQGRGKGFVWEVPMLGGSGKSQY